jgi:hypothetical protein
MLLSGLDPSMLLGFLCKDRENWEDFKRVVEVSALELWFSFCCGRMLMCVWHSLQLGRNHKLMFTIQDEPSRLHGHLIRGSRGLFPNQTIWTWATTTTTKKKLKMTRLTSRSSIARDGTRSSSTSPDASC